MLKVEEPEEPEKPTVKAPTKPQLSTKAKEEKNTQKMAGSSKTFKKAISDSKNEGAKRRRTGEEGSSSFVTTGKDGRKIIKRPNPKGNNRGYKQDKGRKEEKNTKSSTDKTANIKGKKGKICSPIETYFCIDNRLLEMDLESIIKNEKEKKTEVQEEEYDENQYYEQYQQNTYRPRGFHRGRGRYRGRGRGRGRGGFYKPNYEEPEHNEEEETPEGEEGDENAAQTKPKRGGYKGKNYNPYYEQAMQAQMMYYSPQMYGYPMPNYYQGGHRGGRGGSRGAKRGGHMKWVKGMENKESEDPQKKRDTKADEKNSEAHVEPAVENKTKEN